MATSKISKQKGGIIASTKNGAITVKFSGQYTALISTQPWRSDQESLIFVGGYSTGDAHNKWAVLKGGTGLTIEHPEGIYGVKITCGYGYEILVGILPLIGAVESIA